MITLRTPKDLGAVIRERRRHLHWDQRTLAEKVGVSRQWIIDAERGKPRAAVGFVLRTLEALGLRLTVDDGLKNDDGRAIPRPPDIDAVVRRARKARP